MHEFTENSIEMNKKFKHMTTVYDKTCEKFSENMHFVVWFRVRSTKWGLWLYDFPTMLRWRDCTVRVNFGTKRVENRSYDESICVFDLIFV